MLGPLLVMLCGVLSVAAIAIPLLSLWRHQRRGFWRASLAVPGGVLSWAWLSMYAGIAESVWTVQSLMPWTLALLGTIGIALLVLGAHAALRARLKPDDCRACGYPCAGLARCPECGRPPR